MPELPEVEFVRRELHPALSGRTITSAWAHPGERWSQASKSQGLRIDGVSRSGKYLLVRLASGTPSATNLVLHLGMTGRLSIAGAAPREDPPHLRMRLECEDVCLLMSDPRGFGFARIASESDLAGPSWSSSTLGNLGADPLDPAWDVDSVAEDLSRRTAGKCVKAVLLEQRAIAGVGNYIADEALWRARTAPVVRNLTIEQARSVAGAVKSVVENSLGQGGVSVRDYVHADGSSGDFAEALAVYGRAGTPCIRCGTTLVKSSVAGRGTTWCPDCQLA